MGRPIGGAGTVLALLVGSQANATPIDVIQRFDFSASPVTLTPVNHNISPQILSSDQLIVLEVNFHQQFSSFSNLVLAGEPIAGQSGAFAFRWGNWSGNVWQPPNINDGSILALQSTALANANWEAFLGDNSTELRNRAFGPAVDDILDGHFFVSFFLCTLFAQTVSASLAVHSHIRLSRSA